MFKKSFKVFLLFFVLTKIQAIQVKGNPNFQKAGEFNLISTTRTIIFKFLTELAQNPQNGDNNVQAEKDSDTTTLPTNMTNTANGYSPVFTNLNALNRLVVKPSGNMIKIKCPAKGDPKPTNEWTKDGKPIERAMGEVQYGKWGISIEVLIPTDSGAYTCKICFTSKVEITGKVSMKNLTILKLK
jgi:Immunoglobulin domain